MVCDCWVIITSPFMFPFTHLWVVARAGTGDVQRQPGLQVEEVLRLAPDLEADGHGDGQHGGHQPDYQDDCLRSSQLPINRLKIC